MLGLRRAPRRHPDFAMDYRLRACSVDSNFGREGHVRVAQGNGKLDLIGTANSIEATPALVGRWKCNPMP